MDSAFKSWKQGQDKRWSEPRTGIRTISFEQSEDTDRLMMDDINEVPER